MHLKISHIFKKKTNNTEKNKKQNSSLPSDPQISNLSPKVATVNTFSQLGSEV